MNYSDELRQLAIIYIHCDMSYFSHAVLTLYISVVNTAGHLYYYVCFLLTQLTQQVTWSLILFCIFYHLASVGQTLDSGYVRFILCHRLLSLD